MSPHSWTRLALCAAALASAQAGCRGGDEAPGGRRRTPVAAAERPVLEVSGARLQVGFDQKVTLRARVRGAVGDNSTDWDFSWRRVWGPGAGQVKQGATLELTTVAPPTRDQALAHLGGVLPLSAAQAGRVVLEIVATSALGEQLRGELEVVPAFPSAAWPRAAPGVDLYLPVAEGLQWTTRQGQLKVHPTRWSHLARARWVPAPGATTIGGEWNTLTHPPGAAGDPLTVRTGPWLGSKDCGRYDCHPVEQRGWQATKHATILIRGLEGQLPQRQRGRYERRCLACHTLGYQPGANNDGFADRAEQLGWRFPTAVGRGTWRDLPPRLKERANVQCESCHGPGWFYTGYGDDICAQCHDLPPRYPKVEQARRGRMLLAHRSLPATKSAACAQCHVGQAFLRSLRGHASGSKPGTELETARRGISCPTCHDPHGADCPRQLRLCGEVEIPGTSFDAGQGALCVACHTGEADVREGSLLRPFIPGTPGRRGHGRDPAPAPRTAAAAAAAPHAPQFQLLSGRGGKFLALPPGAVERPSYPHLAVPNSCVGCHYEPRVGHSFKLVEEQAPRPARACASTLDWQRLRRSRVTSTCAPCHGPTPNLDAPARGDYDGDGKVRGLITEVEGLMRLLRQALDARIAQLQLAGASGAPGASFTIADEQVVVADASCRPLRQRGGLVTLASRAPLLHKAAFNYLLVVRDGSAGLHNPQYTVKLLQQTVEGLERLAGEKTVHRWKRP